MTQHKIRAFGATAIIISLLCLSAALESPVYSQTSQNTPRFQAPRFLDEPNAELQDESRMAPFQSVVEESEEPVEIQNLDSSSIDAEPLIEDEDQLDVIETPTTDVLDDTAPASVEVNRAPFGNVIEREPYDVYKENGRYFVGWDKPDLALVFTGMTNGYIEPCGCAGMDRMKGGLSRRKAFLNDLKEEMGWDVVSIDTGQITSGFGVQTELKFDMAMNAYHLMQYDAIGIGKGELRFPAYFLLTYTTPTSSTSPSLFTSANIGVYGFHPTYTLPYKIIERGGQKTCIVSVVCSDQSLDQRDENFFFVEPEQKLSELESELKGEKCDSYVLIVHGTEAETTALAEQFPFFNYILTSDTPSEPPAELRQLNDNQSMIEVGEKGKYAIVLGLYDDGSVRYQRVALDSRYASSPEITLLMKDYQSILKSLITSKGFKGGLGINPARSPNAEELGKFVGDMKCRSCHEDAWRICATSGHATAWKSIKETANPPRDFDPECIGCHVIGWNGLQCVPYVDGFESEEKTPHLLNVGCESCHGPGELHVDAELDSDEELQERIRALMRLGDNVKNVCYSCHDGDNSPEFDFDEYYPLIDHSEPDDDDDDE
ncbi:MAG: multiheme c-type cytochrome [Thermoguttaceae bacterium]